MVDAGAGMLWTAGGLVILITAGLLLVRPGFGRGVAVALMLTAVPLALAQPRLLLGEAKPLSFAANKDTSVKDAFILSVVSVEGKVIYLTLMWDDKPHLYSMPWDRTTAQTVMRAMNDAARCGGRPVMHQPFALAWNPAEPRFGAIAPSGTIAAAPAGPVLRLAPSPVPGSDIIRPMGPMKATSGGRSI